jgi:hypothetical protein
MKKMHLPQHSRPYKKHADDLQQKDGHFTVFGQTEAHHGRLYVT